MNAEPELLKAYREWHRLAQAETKAIQTRNWSLLSDCHQAIKDYQTVVGKLTQEARTEWRQAGNLAEKDRNLQVLVADLIDLTRQNQERLKTGLTVTRQQLSELTESGTNLKRLQRSYGSVSTVRARL